MSDEKFEQEISRAISSLLFLEKELKLVDKSIDANLVKREVAKIKKILKALLLPVEAKKADEIKS